MTSLKKRSPKKLRMGVVGCGRVFENYHLPALSKSSDWEFISICEPLSERRVWMQSLCSGSSIFESFEEFLGASNLDAALITTPPASHARLSVQALEAGLHVLVEKPMALRYEEGLLMHDASLQAKKRLWVGYNRRFKRSYLGVKEKLALLPTERIRSIHFEFVLNPQAWKSITRFHEKESRGGGVLDDVASHQMDLLPWILNKRVEAVKAKQSTKPEVGSSLIEFQVMFENGPIAKCEAGHGLRYCENLEIKLENRKLVAYPTGVFESRWIQTGWTRAYCDLREISHLVLHRLTRRSNATLESFERQFKSFAIAVRGEESPSPGADARSGLRCLRAIQACRESLQSGGQWKSIKMLGEESCE